MALERKDLVQDTASSTGTGAFVMAGTPPAGFQAFSVHTNGATFDYKASAGAQWEVGVGTWNGTNIARSPTASSNANGLVNFTTAPTVMEVVSAASVATFLRATDGVDVSTLTPVGSLIAGDTVLLMRSGVLYTAAYTLFGSGSAAASAATGVTLTGPTGGTVSVASASFTVGVTPIGGTITGTVVVTPSDNGGGGTFNPTTVSLTSAAPTATFTYTPSSTAGARTISVTNNGSLSNPTNITYTSTLAAAQTITVATPATQTVGTPFNVTGTYANGTPTALDYRLSDDTAGQWTQVTTATISGGNFSFSVTPTLASAGRTISVRDRTTLVSGTSGNYIVNATATMASQYVLKADGTNGSAWPGASASVGGTSPDKFAQANPVRINILSAGVAPADGAFRVVFGKIGNACPIAFTDTSLPAGSPNGNAQSHANAVYSTPPKWGSWSSNASPYYGTFQCDNMYAWGTSGNYGAWVVFNDGSSKMVDNGTGTPLIFVVP